MAESHRPQLTKEAYSQSTLAIYLFGCEAALLRVSMDESTLAMLSTVRMKRIEFTTSRMNIGTCMYRRSSASAGTSE